MPRLCAGTQAASEGLSPSASAEPLRVVLFYSPSCTSCEPVLRRALPAAVRQWGSRIAVEKHNIDDIEVYRELLKYEQHYDSDENEATKVFLGSRYLSGAKDIGAHLQATIAEELQKGSTTFSVEPQRGPAASAGKVPEEIRQRFLSFKVGSIGIAGLLDGINPCAFTTIVFFLSLLASLGKGKRELATVGIVFSVAVFATYLVLGLGGLSVVKALSVRHGVAKGLTVVVVALAFALATWSLVDFVRYVRSGDVGRVTLGLPSSIKLRIRRSLSAGMRTRGLIIGSASVGCTVALLESLCTGQVYLPTITFLTRDPGLRVHAVAYLFLVHAVAYLFLYNLAFIAPLLVVFSIAYAGVSSERLGAFLRRHLGALKLSMAVLFAALGVMESSPESSVKVHLQVP